MSHAIWEKRFVGHRKPGWHNLGQVVQAEINATEGFLRMGQYDTALLPLVVILPDGSQMEVGHRAIVRMPTPDTPEHEVTGVVGPGYYMISPYDVVQSLDFALGERHIETIGALNNGKDFFVTYQMPTVEIGSEPVENYLVVSSPYDGKKALRVMTTPLRVVCQNTLIAAQRMASESFALRHDEHVVERLAKWVEGLWPRAVQRSEELAAAFTIMTQRRVSQQRAEKLVGWIVNYPAKPKRVPDDEANYQRKEDWEARCKRIDKDRTGILELFAGRGTGMDTPEAEGTAWGLYNSVTEFYDHGRKVNNIESGIADALFGRAASIKAQAFEALLDEAKVA